MSLQQAYRQLLADDDILTKEFRLTIDTKDFPKKGAFLPTGQPHKPHETSRQSDVKDVSAADSSTASVAPPTEVKNGWQQLGLLYSPSWPLHLLFTPKIVQQLDTVFRFVWDGY